MAGVVNISVDMLCDAIFSIQLSLTDAALENIQNIFKIYLKISINITWLSPGIPPPSLKRRSIL